ncbi:MAG: hypothetical protein ACRC46_03515 [Thermoguttaceae bacterium]
MSKRARKSEADIRKEVIEVLEREPQLLYNGKSCKSINTKSYSDMAAGIIIEHVDKLEKIQLHEREGSYNQEHKGKLYGERITAINIFNNFDINSNPKFNPNSEHDHIGKILDYETPLKKEGRSETGERIGKGVGKIDLISYNENKNFVYLLELKIKGNKDTDTLLRATLEIYTYWKMLQHDKLIKEFDDLNQKSPEPEIKKAVLLFKDCTAYNQYCSETSPNTIALMEKLGVDFFCVKENPKGGFEISDKGFEEQKT